MTARFGVPFYFPSPNYPEQDCPRWRDRDKGTPCAGCGIPLLQEPDCSWRGRCYECYLAEEKRRRKKVPLLIANRAQDALGSDSNEVTLLDDAGQHPLPRMDKLALGRRLIAEIASRVTRVHG